MDLTEDIQKINQILEVDTNRIIESITTELNLRFDRYINIKLIQFIHYRNDILEAIMRNNVRIMNQLSMYSMSTRRSRRIQENEIGIKFHKYYTRNSYSYRNQYIRNDTNRGAPVVRISE